MQSNNRVIVGLLGHVKLFHCSRTSGIHAQIAIYGSRPFIQADLIVALLLREDCLILTEKFSEQESLLTYLYFYAMPAFSLLSFLTVLLQFDGKEMVSFFFPPGGEKKLEILMGIVYITSLAYS